MKVKDMTKGIALERLVLGNSKRLFHHQRSEHNIPYIPNNENIIRNSSFSEGTEYNDEAKISNWKRAAEKISEDKTSQRANVTEAFPEFKESNKGCCQSAICWWEPKLPSLPAEFCLDSSMHGLKYLAQPKRHLTERIFWAVMFLGGIAAAVLLINSVWERYNANPVIVSFNPLETDIDSIPFPAVTVCNINKFPKSLVNTITRTANGYGSLGGDEKAVAKAKEELLYINSACTLQDSFAKSLNFSYRRGDVVFDMSEAGNETLSKDGAGDALLEFLLTRTLPCDRMIRHCLWAENPVPCGKIFKPIVTDYGKCCTFNIFPIPLLLKPQPKKEPTNNETAMKTRWSKAELDDWSKWNYDEGILINKKLNLKYPYRQKRAGMPYGLSFLIDPNTKDYFCPASDSDGVRFMLHSQLEIPHISEFGSVIGLGNEVFVEMQPDVTLANKEIREFDSGTRHCLFGKEASLDFYQAYSVSSCLDECESEILAANCNCSYYYMPRRDETDICNTEPGSSHRSCIRKTKDIGETIVYPVDQLSTLEKACGHCSVLCEDVAYNFETTTSVLQRPEILWGDHADKTLPKPDWMENDMALVHIYFGADSTVPKIRQKMFGITDLIANTGGLLGLCLGFSVLSLVEVIYFLTLRLFWQKIRRRLVVKQIATKLMKAFKGPEVPKKKNEDLDLENVSWRSDEASNSRNRVIQLDRQHLPLYPAYLNKDSRNQDRQQPEHFSYNGNYGRNMY